MTQVFILALPKQVHHFSLDYTKKTSIPFPDLYVEILKCLMNFTYKVNLCNKNNVIWKKKKKKKTGD